MKFSVVIIALVVITVGCNTYDFVQTGMAEKPLPENYPVKVIQDSKKPVKYTEIGMLRVYRTNFTVDNNMEAIQVAQDVARGAGGDVIILHSTQTTKYFHHYPHGTETYESPESWNFIIGKLISAEKEEQK